MQHFFFIGIGGSGMSRLALFCKELGIQVSGSDRLYTQECRHPLIETLLNAGIFLFAQNGSGITNLIQRVVVSAAIEDDNPDLMRANELNIPVITRSQLLAEFFNQHNGIAISGTSGKTTTTGMVSTVLRSAHIPHRFYCGDDLLDPVPLMAPLNKDLAHMMVAEVDESDGSPIFYYPNVSIITNISFDHKTVESTTEVLKSFALQSREMVIMNADCQHSKQLMAQLEPKKVVTFGIFNEADFRAVDITYNFPGIRFRCNNFEFDLSVPGMHNVYNALATIALLNAQNIPLEEIHTGLRAFKGMKRRLELIGSVNNIRFYDDFSHNPEKIQAALTALKQFGSRLFVIFRPHGYGPMIMFRSHLAETFSAILSENDRIFFLDIYDTGGTANRSIHSADLVSDLCARSLNAQYIPDPNKIIPQLESELRDGDTVVIMGARDPFLGDYAHRLAQRLIDHCSNRV